MLHDRARQLGDVRQRLRGSSYPLRLSWGTTSPGELSCSGNSASRGWRVRMVVGSAEIPGCHWRWSASECDRVPRLGGHELALSMATMRAHSCWLLIATVAACTEGGSPEGAGDRCLCSIAAVPAGGAAAGPAAGRRARPSDGNYSCTTENLKETRQFDRIVAYAANSDSLWPGAIVSADSVASGLFTQIVLPRAPATFSVSLENWPARSRRRSIGRACRPTGTRCRACWPPRSRGSTPANIYSEIEEVHSEEQLNMALGVQASWGLGLASLKSSFNFGNSSVRSRYVVRYTQGYYTVDLDAPESPSALLGSEATLEDVREKMSEEHPPAYVSSVTYGRMIVFTFEIAVQRDGARRGPRLRVLRRCRRQGRRLGHLQGHHLEQQDHGVHPRRRRRRPRSRRSIATSRS